VRPAPGSGATGPPEAAPLEAVVGLEVHCQLGTLTKLFCGCANRFGAPPNTLVCPVCTGQPGALPATNREAVALAVRVALAVGAEVAPWSRFDRKNYFYPDLPKGYQISQLERPYCSGGGLDLAGGKRVRFTRIHLEEDAGKALHVEGSTLVDLNRAGVPLIEAVTEPDLASAAEAREFLDRYKELLQYVGASDCDMEKGSLRCDVNVSVRRPGEALRTKVELKNLNSFTGVEKAIAAELARQTDLYARGLEVVQETRQYDAQADCTRPMRDKEQAHDYRYFPEPDLPPVVVNGAAVERERSAIPELPAARRARYVTALGLSAYDAGVLTSSRALADFFEATVRLSGAAKEAANWLANQVLAHLADPATPAGSIDELALKPHDLAELIDLVERGRTTRAGAKDILAALVRSEVQRRPAELMHELGLVQVSDGDQLEGWCRAALEGREDVIADVRAGKEKALGALIGPVMRAAGGRADPAAVRAALLRLIRAGD